MKTRHTEVRELADVQKKLKRSVLAAGSSPSPLTTSNIQDYSKSWGSRDSSHLTSLATPPRVSLRITHHSLEPLARLRAAIPIASVAHVPDRRSPFTCHQLLLSLVVHLVAWLGKCHIDTRLSMAPARESPWSLGTPGVRSNTPLLL